MHLSQLTPQVLYFNISTIHVKKEKEKFAAGKVIDHSSLVLESRILQALTLGGAMSVRVQESRRHRCLVPRALLGGKDEAIKQLWANKKYPGQTEMPNRDSATVHRSGEGEFSPLFLSSATTSFSLSVVAKSMDSTAQELRVSSWPSAHWLRDFGLWISSNLV